jgi:hypothetical protein
MTAPPLRSATEGNYASNRICALFREPISRVIVGDYLRRPVIGTTPGRFMLYQALPR